mgnify:CR=1 FL=1
MTNKNLSYIANAAHETHKKYPIPLALLSNHFQEATSEIGEFLYEEGLPQYATYRALIERAIKGYGEAQVAAFDIYNHLVWLKYHMPVYKLTTSITAAFALTDTSDIPREEIVAPFPYFIIKLPSNFWYAQDVIDGPFLGIDLLSVSRHDFLGGASSILFTMAFTNGRLHQWTRPSTIPEEEGIALTSADNAIPDNTRLYMYALEKVYKNLCIFLDQTNPDIKKERKHAALKKRVRRKAKRKQEKGKTIFETPEIWVVGADTKIAPGVIAAAKTMTSQKKWKLTKRIVVAGHWKWQPYGPRNSLRKRIRLDPYIKGENYAERLTRKYVVDEIKPSKNPEELQMLSPYEEEAAYGEGTVAAMQGVPKSACPYRDRDLRAAWLDGYGEYAPVERRERRERRAGIKRAKRNPKELKMREHGNFEHSGDYDIFYDRGFNEAAAGYESDNCDYSARTEKGAAWRKGWQDYHSRNSKRGVQRNPHVFIGQHTYDAPQFTDPGSFVNFLEYTLIPDLYESGTEATAENFQEAVFWLKRYMRYGRGAVTKKVMEYDDY